MHSHIPVDARAVEADVDAERHTCPGRVPSLTIEACLAYGQTVLAYPGPHVRTLLPFCDLSTLNTCSVSAFVGSAMSGKGFRGGRRRTMEELTAETRRRIALTGRLIELIRII